MTIFDGKKVFRRFFPGTKEFSAKNNYVYDKARNFWLEVIDQKEKRAFAGPIRVNHKVFNAEMCADNQNNILSLAVPEKNDNVLLGTWLTRRQLGAIWVTDGGVAGYAGLVCPGKELAPMNYETGSTSSLFWIRLGSALYTPDGVRYCGLSSLPVLRNIFSSEDCTIINYYSTSPPDSDTDMNIKITSFRPKLYGYNIFVFELESRVKKDIKLTDRKDGLEVELLKVPVDLLVGFWPNYTYLGSDNKKYQGTLSRNEECVTKVEVPAAKLSRNGYVALWPNAAGSVAVYPLDKEEYDFSIINYGPKIKDYDHGGECIFIGYKKPGDIIPAGTVLRSKLLLVLDNGEAKDDSVFDEFRDIYGFDGTPAYKTNLTHGKLLDDVYSLSLEATDYYVSGVIDKAKLPNPLGITIKGVNENWSSAFCNQTTGKLEPVGIHDETAYFALDLSEQVKFYTGNIIISDHPEVKLEFLEKVGKYSKFLAHNPTDSSVTFKVKIPKEIEFIPEVDSSWSLTPGETAYLYGYKDFLGTELPK